MTTATNQLRAVPLFAGIPDRSIDAIGAVTREASYESGADLVREGEPGESFIILIEGAATVRQGGVELATMGPGDFLGEIALIDRGTRTATVTADQPVKGLVIGCDDFARLMDEQPPIRLGVLMALTERIRRHPVPLD